MDEIKMANLKLKGEVTTENVYLTLLAIKIKCLAVAFDIHSLLDCCQIFGLYFQVLFNALNIGLNFCYLVLELLDEFIFDPTFFSFSI